MMNTLKIWAKKRWVRVLAMIVVLFGVLFALRVPILRGTGRYLVASDPLEKTDAYFILGGNSYERGMEALKVWAQYPDAQFVATGGNYPTQIQALDTLMKEAELTRYLLVHRGVPAAQVDTLGGSTSTLEESEEILAYCQKKGLERITLISSSFHLRRMRMVFEDKYEKAGIQVRFHGATDSEFATQDWWQNEQGLITTNNEYIKILYYWVKY